MNKVEITISESSFNCFRHLYEIDGDQIKKIAENSSWSYLICQNILPLKGQYYFSTIILKSKNNNIQVGLAPLTYYPRFNENEDDEQFICFNCNNGMIKDSKQNQDALETKWRMGGEEVNVG